MSCSLALTTVTSTSSTAQAMSSFASSISTSGNGPLSSSEDDLSDGSQPDCQLHTSTENEIEEELTDSEEDLLAISVATTAFQELRRHRQSNKEDIPSQARMSNVSQKRPIETSSSVHARPRKRSRTLPALTRCRGGSITRLAEMSKSEIRESPKNKNVTEIE